MTRDDLLLKVAAGEIPVAQAIELLSGLDKANPKPKAERKANPKPPQAHSASDGLKWPEWCVRRDGAVPHPTSPIVSDTEVLQAVAKGWVEPCDAMELLTSSR